MQLIDLRLILVPKEPVHHVDWDHVTERVEEPNHVVDLEIVCSLREGTAVALFIAVAEVSSVLSQDFELLFLCDARDRHLASLDICAFRVGKQ